MGGIVFVTWAESDPKNSIFRLSCALEAFCKVLYKSTTTTTTTTAYRKQFYPEPMVLMKSRDSEGVPFASLESL